MVYRALALILLSHTHTHIHTHAHTHTYKTTVGLLLQLTCLNQIDDSPLTLALHSLTRHFTISRFLSRTATARGDSPGLVTGAVVMEYVVILLCYNVHTHMHTLTHACTQVCTHTHTHTLNTLTHTHTH